MHVHLACECAGVHEDYDGVGANGWTVVLVGHNLGGLAARAMIVNLMLGLEGRSLWRGAWPLRSWLRSELT